MRARTGLIDRFRVSVFLCAGISAASLHAQGLHSESRAITLLAVKRPEFDEIDAVRVSSPTLRVIPGENGFEVTALARVNVEGRCTIRIARERPSTASPAYVGDCHESAPPHELTLRVDDASARSADPILVEVTSILDGVPRRWLVELRIPKRPAEP